MSITEATQALGDAIESDARTDAEIMAPAPEQATTPTVTPGESSPTSEVAAPATAEDTFDGGAFNPDTLPEELRPGWSQLQAAFTRKTQELAEQRKQFESLGDVETLAQARELYTRLQDPTNWPALHAELSEALEQQGLTPAQANAEASRQIEQATPAAPGTPSSLDAIVAADPELAPLVEQLKATQTELEGFKSAQVAAQEQARQEQEYMALVGELTRQENAIRDMKRSDGTSVYAQDDIDEMYELSSFYNGNLIEAQQRFEAMRSRWAGNYFAQKDAVNANAPTTISGGGTLSQPTSEAPADLDAALDAALEEARNTGLLDAEF
jgi:hypothetical protein